VLVNMLSQYHELFRLCRVTKPDTAAELSVGLFEANDSEVDD